MVDIQSPDEEEMPEQQPLPEGFRLQADSIHCLNIMEAGKFQAYIRQICNNFISVVKKGKDVEEEYWKVVRSIYWVCQAVGSKLLIAEAEPELIPDL